MLLFGFTSTELQLKQFAEIDRSYPNYGRTISFTSEIPSMLPEIIHK